MPVITDDNGDEWYFAMPLKKLDPSKPVYLRVGDWNPEAWRSWNFSSGYREKGLSVYALDPRGHPITPDGEWSATDLRTRLNGDNAKYLVQGKALKSVGGEGEPLLSKPHVVGLWKPIPTPDQR